MWPFKNKQPERISWNGAIGSSRARCTHCNRDIEQEETKITFYSDGWGNCRPAGKVWCNECGAEHKFDKRDNY